MQSQDHLIKGVARCRRATEQSDTRLFNCIQTREPLTSSGLLSTLTLHPVEKFQGPRDTERVTTRLKPSRPISRAEARRRISAGPSRISAVSLSRRSSRPVNLGTLSVRETPSEPANCPRKGSVEPVRALREQVPDVTDDGLLRTVDQPLPVAIIADNLLPRIDPRRQAMDRTRKLDAKLTWRDTRPTDRTAQ
jgi:hypothetical protein